MLLLSARLLPELLLFIYSMNIGEVEIREEGEGFSRGKEVLSHMIVR